MDYKYTYPRRLWAAFVSLGLAILMIVISAPPGTAASRSIDGEQIESMINYSKSGYDLTRLSREEIEKIADTLTPEERRITLEAGTEPAFCGNLTNAETAGIYVSVVGGLPLFRSSGKFTSKSGWASFFEPFDPDHIVERIDSSHGMERIEIIDARSGAHLGHLFEDGPKPTGRRYCVNSAALQFIPDGEPIPLESQPVKSETAYFAGGCFWGIEHKFSQITGVIDAASGYQGGHVDTPGYRQVCGGETGHAESVRILFDPARVSYNELLRLFFEMHDPTTEDRQGPDIGSQYRSAIFTTSGQQAEAANAYIAQLDSAGDLPDQIVTTIEAAPKFFEAEDYHQNYHAKHRTSCSW
jgi:peptide methionine sulfoxide reductase msrA/msrB